MIVRLRTLTLKSVLGFGGWHKDKTILEMFLRYEELELLRLYYYMGNIDFNDEIKEKLCITKEREIEKPGNIRLPKVHPTLGIIGPEVIGLCLIDFNAKNDTPEYRKFKESFRQSQKKGYRNFVDRQFGEKGYNKACMAWVNQHYGINR